MKYINVVLDLVIPISNDYDQEQAIQDIYDGTFQSGAALEECASDILISEIWCEEHDE